MRKFSALIALLPLLFTPIDSAEAQSAGGNASLSVTTTTGAVALPASTSQFPAILVVPANGSTAEVFYKFGPSAIAATTASPALPAGGICFTNVGSANNYLAAITATGTATLRITQFPYCPQSWAGAGGASSGGGTSNVAITSPLSSTTLDAAALATTLAGTPVTGFSFPAGCAGAVGSLGYFSCLINQTSSSIPAGGNKIGQVAVDQTTDGITNLVATKATNGDACQNTTKKTQPISLTASAQIFAGTASKKNYICAINIINGGTAQNVALVEGTGTVCATNIYGLSGGTTANTGWNFAANGGIAEGNGGFWIFGGDQDTNGTAANVCLLLSGSVQVSGSISYAQQ